ncbi:MAG TPA: CocE/NonD family hydrolase [Candidatus Thermoplasmatota archaeon]|nr:CocE/NonD family hydrolase [Candidatus Thermoplasmatota archaeon]
MIPGCITSPEPTPEPATPAPALPKEFLVAPKFAVLPGVSEFFESHDGVKLHQRLFLPDTSAFDVAALASANLTPDLAPIAPGEWKAPIILVMSPYFDEASRANPSDPASMPGYERYAWLVTHFVPKGYAVILSDVRGTGESGGCLEQTGPLQMEDEYLLIEHYATQAWANGKVGMFGKSYDGETQQSALVMRPPHLTTIIPLSSVAGQYEWNFYDGVPYTVNGLAGMVSYAQIGLTPGTTTDSRTMYAERAGCHPENLKEGADPSGDMNTFWKSREFRELRHEANGTSVFYVHGLADWNVKPNHIRDWFNDLNVPKTAWLGQWGHDYPEENRVVPEWSRHDWRDAVEAWFDHWLLGAPTGADQWVGTVQVQDSLGRWRTEEAWPPHDATSGLWYLADGKLHAAPTESAPSMYREEARNALDFPTVGTRRGVLFEGEALTADLHYAGTPWVNFTAVVDRPDTHFAIQLLAIHANGDEEIVNRGYLSAPHRESLESPSLLTPGAPTRFSVRLFPQDDVIPAGARLAVWMSAVDDWVQPAGTGATVTVLHTKDAPATLDLPLVAPTESDFLDVPMGTPKA